MLFIISVIQMEMMNKIIFSFFNRMLQLFFRLVVVTTAEMRIYVSLFESTGLDSNVNQPAIGVVLVRSEYSLRL